MNQPSIRSLLWMAFIAFSLPAQAANTNLQNLFFAACINPTAELATRCAETTDGAGDLSGDSESSLNPSQSLSGAQIAARSARGRAENTRDRVDGSDGGAGARVDIGKLSVLFNLGQTWEDRDRTPDVDQERGFESDIGNFDFGFDYRISDASVMGLLVNYEWADLDYDRESNGVNFSPAARAGGIDSESWGVTGFASIGIGTSAYLDISAGYQSGENDYQRRSIFQESNRAVPQTLSVTEGSANTTKTWVSVNVGWQRPSATWSLGVYGGLNYINSEVDSFTERDLTNTGLAMSFSSADQTSILGIVGVRAQRPISTGSGVLMPYARFDYTHDFGADAVDIRSRYLLDAGDNFLSLTSDEPDKNYFTGAVGLSMILPNGWIPFVDLAYWMGYDDLDRMRLQIGLRKEL